jgi:hypothetical protein
MFFEICIRKKETALAKWIKDLTKKGAKMLFFEQRSSKERKGALRA